MERDKRRSITRYTIVYTGRQNVNSSGLHSRFCFLWYKKCKESLKVFLVCYASQHTSPKPDQGLLCHCPRHLSGTLEESVEFLCYSRYQLIAHLLAVCPKCNHKPSLSFMLDKLPHIRITMHSQRPILM